MKKFDKLIWDLDAYKVGHMSQYPEDTQYIYSVFQLRSNRYFSEVPIIGLQYFLKEYLSTSITHEEVDELIVELKNMGIYHPSTESKLKALADLGYLPIEIKAIPEGCIVQMPNAICSIENTVPGFHWVVGMVETLLLKWWGTLATSACSYNYRKIAEKYFNETSDNEGLIDFIVHDFGSRGCMSPEDAALTGMAHALNFKGSDTIIATPFIRQYYNADKDTTLIASVPASEHSVMCSYGKENEIEAFKAMLNLYPTGIVSIVSDTYNWYNVMENFTVELKDKILSRDGKVVFRPDSGNPVEIICGNPMAKDKESAEYLGAIRYLDKVFGHTVNSKGYKVLNSHVGIIYGDGMYLQRYEETLKRLKQMGYSAENLTIGVGGILRNHTRDTLGGAFKATAVCRNGEWIDIMKDPITDTKKKSYCGKVQVEFNTVTGIYTTVQESDARNDAVYETMLRPVFKDSKVLINYDWFTIKKWYEVDKEFYLKTL